MLRNLHELEGFSLEASDGVVGTIRDAYFDDRQWVVRYLIVETGSWLASRQVLISPIGLGQPDWDAKRIPCRATRAQIQGSPDIDLARPVSRQQEAEYGSYYGYPDYWTGDGLWGANVVPGLTESGRFESAYVRLREAEHYYRRLAEQHLSTDDPHLRSFEVVRKYHVHATDGNIGHLESMLIDDRTWSIRYLTANTSNWWLGHLILLVPQWIKSISWLESEVRVDMTLDDIRQAPAYDPHAPIDRPLEIATHRHHRKPGYWGPTPQDSEAAAR